MRQAPRKLKQKLDRRRKPNPILWVLIVAVGVVIVFGVSQVPAVRERLTPRVAQLRVAVKNFFNPPEQSVFVPQGVSTSTLLAEEGTSTLTPPEITSPATVITVVATPTPTEVFQPTVTPQPAQLPSVVWLDGFSLEYQTFNNCGPANLSMMLNYWGFLTSQNDLKPFLRPSREDRNVNLYEMRDYVNNHTSLVAQMRYGGDLSLLKQLIAAGFPILLERGHTDPSDGWMGHYSIINSYDDEHLRVHIPDSLVGNLYLSYEELMKDWLHFANVYLVIYPPERETNVMGILGSQADEMVNLQTSLDEFTQITYESVGQDQFFAWYSKGTILTEMGRYSEATEAYGEAFKIYPLLDFKERPWRLTWYQEGPYLAYYQVGRFQDTLNLAIKTIDDTTEDSLPETWWWAGKAAAALGLQADAERYFRQALYWYPDWQPAVDELVLLGVQP